jgi:hypothetical protein
MLEFFSRFVFASLKRRGFARFGFAGCGYPVASGIRGMCKGF